MGESPRVNVFRESDLEFHFLFPTIQYDSTDYYTGYVKKLEGTKAVDFLTIYKGKSNSETLCLMEVKNFRKSDKSISERTNPKGNDPLHIEIAQKVRDTLAGLVGAMTSERKCFAELEPYYRVIRNENPQRSQLVVIAFVEGSRLGGYQSGHQDGAMGLKRAIEKSLKWLGCEVRVLNIESIQKYGIDWFDAT